MAKKKVVVRGPRLVWATLWADILGVVTKKRTLAVLLSRSPTGEYAAIAVEADRKKSNTLMEVFGAHAHAIIGDDFKDQATARKASEKYARAWLAGRAKKNDPCECGDIEAIAANKRSKRSGVQPARGSRPAKFALRRGNPSGIIDAEFEG